MQRVHGLEEARAALQGGATHLSSPPFAACHSGVNYYRAMLDALAQEFPDHPFSFALCCGDNPAIAHDALRFGFREVVCAVDAPMLGQLQAMAATVGARVYPTLDAAQQAATQAAQIT